MDKKLFSNYLRDKIINVPISVDDLQNNQGIKLDVNHNLPEKIDGEKFIHYYYYNSDVDEIGLAVSLHNLRVSDWNRRHPNNQINLIDFSDEILYPIFIKNKTVYDKELFKLVRTIGIESFAKVLNKTALEYFKEKISLAKKHKITPGLQDKIQSQIVEINEWFINNDIDLDNIDSLFIYEVKDYITPDNVELFIPKQNELEMQKPVSSASKERHKGKEDFNGYIYGLADDMRDRKKNREFDTYRDAYRYAETHYTVNGKDITWKQLERNYDKAKCIGKLD